MNHPELTQQLDAADETPRPTSQDTLAARRQATEPFDATFRAVFDAEFHRLYRYFDRLTGDPDLAADLVQEAFVKLYRKGELPDAPAAWLITVATNLLRNAGARASVRRRLLTVTRAEAAHSEIQPSPEEAAVANDVRRQVRAALDRLPERERRLLLLFAEGYRYREIALTLGINEASIGVLLARAKRAFRDSYPDGFDES